MGSSPRSWPAPSSARGASPPRCSSCWNGEAPGEDSPARRLVASARRASQPPPASAVIRARRRRGHSRRARGRRRERRASRCCRWRTHRHPPAAGAGGGVEHAEEDAILAEAKNGYDLLFLGLGPKATPGSDCFPEDRGALVQQFRRTRGDGDRLRRGARETGRRLSASSCRRPAPTTPASARRSPSPSPREPAPPSPRCTSPPRPPMWSSGAAAATGFAPCAPSWTKSSRSGSAKGCGCSPRPSAARRRKAPSCRRRRTAGHQLIVLGTKGWTGDRLHFGQSVATLIEAAPCPLLVVKL